MTALKVFLVFLGVFAIPVTALQERQCGTTFSNLWLDVVVVVDTSSGMTKTGLTNVAGNIDSVFRGPQIGIDPSQRKTTRIGLVSYNSNATVNADLNKYGSYADFSNGVFLSLNNAVSNSPTSYLAYGLSAAENLFATQSDGSDRNHYQRAIIVYASAYEGVNDRDPLPIAERLRTNGVTIMTVSYNQDNGNVLNGLQKIASPRYNFVNDGDVISNLKNALMQTNCYCVESWEHYRDSWSDISSKRYGVCLQAVGITALWKIAQMSCRNRVVGGYLASEYTQAKHDFILQMAKNITGFGYPVYSYHIGLNFVNNGWYWDQPENYPLKPFNPDNDWSNWRTGYPTAQSQMSAVWNYQYGESTRWQNIGNYATAANYFCEVASCDTDKYCSADGS